MYELCELFEKSSRQYILYEKFDFNSAGLQSDYGVTTVGYVSNENRIYLLECARSGKSGYAKLMHECKKTYTDLLLYLSFPTANCPECFFTHRYTFCGTDSKLE